MGRVPCTYGYAVAFPDCVFQGSLPPGGHGAIMADANDLNSFGPKVSEALEQWSRANRRMAPGEYERLMEALQSRFQLVRSHRRSIDEDEEVLVRLTEQQAAALERIYANDRVLVEGTAGSGKTLLALHRAESYAAGGKDVLLLCFNSIGTWRSTSVAAPPPRGS